MFGKKRKAKEEARKIAAHNELTWRAPLSERVDAEGRLHIDAPIGERAVRILPLHNTIPIADGFRSTAASQWSTPDTKAVKKVFRPLNPFTLQRSYRDGKINGVSIDSLALHNQLAHWKWLIHNPKLAYKVVRKAKSEKQRIADSALFL